MTDSQIPPLPNNIYNVLKFLAQILLPAAGTLYFALANTWKLPNAEQVVGTITAVDVFLGILLGLSTKRYNKSDAKYDGAIEVTNPGDGPKLFSLNLSSNLDDLDKKKEVTFKVSPQ